MEVDQSEGCMAGARTEVPLYYKFPKRPGPNFAQGNRVGGGNSGDSGRKKWRIDASGKRFSVKIRVRSNCATSG
eukprot:scaffold3309_cov276-Pinguiococcus_pyrenoidosus.AAC.1